MVLSEAEFMVNNYFSYQGEMSDENKSKLIESMKPMAEGRVRQRLVLQRIVELEGIEVTDEQLEKTFNEMAEQEEEKTVDEIKADWEEKGMIDGLKKQIARSNAMDWLRENVKVIEKVETPETEEEASQENDSDESEEKSE